MTGTRTAAKPAAARKTPASKTTPKAGMTDWPRFPHRHADELLARIQDVTVDAPPPFYSDLELGKLGAIELEAGRLVDEALAEVYDRIDAAACEVHKGRPLPRHRAMTGCGDAPPLGAERELVWEHIPWPPAGRKPAVRVGPSPVVEPLTAEQEKSLAKFFGAHAEDGSASRAERRSAGFFAEDDAPDFPPDEKRDDEEVPEPALDEASPRSPTAEATALKTDQARVRIPPGTPGEPPPAGDGTDGSGDEGEAAE